MNKWEVHYYVSGISGQLVTVVTTASRADAEAAVRAMYAGKTVNIHRVVRL
jgi:hypothetical protein